MEITGTVPASPNQLTRPVVAEQSQRYIDQVWTIIHRLEDSHPAFKGFVQQIKIDASPLGADKSPARAILNGEKTTLVVSPVVPELYALSDQPCLTFEQREEAERAWTRYVPTSIPRAKSEELSTDIDGRSQALLTCLFRERYPEARFRDLSPAKIAESMCNDGTTKAELLARVRASFLTQYLVPNKCSLDAMLIHEMEHLRRGDEDPKVNQGPDFLKTRPDLVARFPRIAQEQFPAISKAFLVLPLVTLAASVFSDVSTVAGLVLSGLSLYLTGSYFSVRHTIRQDNVMEMRHAFKEWREIGADLGVINHGSREEIAGARDLFVHYKTELALDYLFTHSMTAFIQGSPWRRLLRVVASGNRFVQGLIYRIVSGRSPLPSEAPSCSFEKNYAAKWGRTLHIEGWKRLSVWDENVKKKTST